MSEPTKYGENFVLPDHMRDKNGYLDTTRYQLIQSYCNNSTGVLCTVQTEITLKKNPTDPNIVNLGLVACNHAHTN
jgi:hypothetical protein